MVICKYFLRGTCRFGENCKNEHVYTENVASSMMRKKEVDVNVLIKAVSNDMDKAEKGHQWPLTCYGPFQGKPCFPGFEDKSFEEIRLEMYEAKKNGTVDQYKQFLTQVLNESRMKMRSLLNPTHEAVHVIQELYNNPAPGTQTSNVFTKTNTFGNGSTQSNTFSFLNNAGGQSKNIFGSTSTSGTNFSFVSPESKSIFGNTANNQISTNNANSIFGNQQQQGFQTGFFGVGDGQQSQKLNMFATPQQTFPSSNNIFQPAKVFAAPGSFGAEPAAPINVFAQNTQATSLPNLFTQNNQALNPFKPAPSFAVQNPPFASSVTVNPLPFATIQGPSFGAQTSTFGAANLSPFGSTTTTTTTPINNLSVFRANVQALANKSSFGSNQPIFGSNQLPFAAANPPTFPVATNNSTSLFNVVAPITNTNQPVFGGAGAGGNIFTQPIVSTQNIFNTSTNNFSQNAFGSTQITAKRDDPSIYSNIQDLSESDKQSYEAAFFELGKIPEKAPTLQMCTG